MKKILGIILLLIAFAIGADVKPFTYDNIAADSATQQKQYEYMLQYKLYGRDYMDIGIRVRIPDKSGWNGSSGNITSKEQLVLGGPVLTDSTISLGNECKLTTGPIRANTFTSTNDNGNALFAGNICLVNPVDANSETMKGITRAGGKFSCDTVPSAPTGLSMPTITFPDTTNLDITVADRGKVFIDIPDVPSYDLYVNSIRTGTEDTLFFRLSNRGTLTRVFVKEDISLGNHTVIQTFYNDSAVAQDKYRGNLLFYTTKDINIVNSDNTEMQGTYISTQKIYLACNINFAGQLLANQLQIGNDFKGENFHFVKFDPDTIDVKLDKYGGLRENDSTVVIPVELSDTASVAVFFTYCFDLKDGVTMEDFNPPKFPICGQDASIEVSIPRGSKVPDMPIKVNVKIDTLEELNDYLVLHIDYINGAILPNGETSGELKIKIIDAVPPQNKSVILDKTDTIKTYQEELRIPPGTGIVGNVKYTDDSLAPLVWSIEDPSGLFTITDGVITTNHVFDYETEDTVYVVKVKVVDGEFADSANYTIKITNVQEPITVSGKVDGANENADIGTPIGAIIGKDADSIDVTYGINTTDFKIDPITGVITVNTLLDYETKTTYPVKVTVKSTDGSTKDTSFVIKVLDVDEPVHAHDTTFVVDEGKKGPIGTVTGEDEDGKPVKFTCDDTVHYNIDTNTGVLRLVDPFDYETTKSDTVQVFVTDVNGNVDTATIVINVKNVNEPPVLQKNDSLTVPENCKSCIVGIITAIDPDDDPIKYTVKEPGFTIDSNGVLKLTEPLDHEKTPTVTITVIAKDPSGAIDSAKYTITVTDINEPVHTKDTTCSVKENYTGNVCKIPATDDDGTKPKYIVTDTTNYAIDSTGQLVIKNPIDYEKKTKDTVKVIVTDGEFYDTATVIIRVLDEDEIPEIKTWDDEKPKDTVKTNEPDHKYEWQICEGDTCTGGTEYPHITKDTTIKICNVKKTKCDSIVVLFNDAPPVVTLTNAKSTDALIDYITIEEQKDNQIYVNRKDNKLTVTVKDTVHKTEKSFPINVKLDTVHVSSKNVVEYNYLIDETLAQFTSIGGNKVEKKEVIKVDGREIVITEIVDKNGKSLDTVQTVTYKVKQDGKEITISYKTDNLTGQRIGDYKVSYNIDSCTTVSYFLNDNKKIVKNKEGNIAYTIDYEYTDDFGNKASSKVDIIFDDIPPKVEILTPHEMEKFNTNAIPIKWTVNGETQDTLTLQRLEKGLNTIIRRYVDKAGNVSADTVMIFMNEAKDIAIEIVNPVTEVNQDKVDSFYSEGNTYNDKKPYTITTLKSDDKPDPVGIGFKIDIALPSVSATGNVSTLADIIKNDKIPVDEKGNVVGASNIGISVEEYINENCTDDFRQDYHKNGTNIPLYNVKYNLHLWIYTSNANYVNDFEINYDIDSKTEANAASIANFVIDWVPEKDGNVKANNQHSLGTGAYLVKLYSKSTAICRCGFKNQKAGDKITKKEYSLKSFGYKRPNK